MPFSSLSNSLSVHRGGVSDPVLCVVGSTLCEEVAAAVTPHPRLPCPSSPSASAGQPHKRWLDSREAPILQPRQSRLHRWVTNQACKQATLVFDFFFFEAQISEIMWSCFWNSLSCLFVISGVAHVCIFHVKEAFFSTQACSKHTQTEMPEGSGGFSRGF